jgi:DNA-binding response OmpR family regulator
MKIMIIDDEEDILNLFADFLSKEGYDVVTYLEPLKALKEIENNPSRYSLIITDIRMPGISGIDLIRKVSSINTDIKVILMSAFEINGDELKELTYNEHLQKPIHMHALASTIREILGPDTADHK